MRQVTGRISTYSSDEFGICSALYELGGMIVMHDASGCNSTYTTHDEPRWYDMDSMIFISAISEVEAIMGDDDKFIDDLIETASELHPEFIALVGAPIPYMIGTDLEAIAAIVERETGIPCFGFAANGMHPYTRGISMALERIVQSFCEASAEYSSEQSSSIEVHRGGVMPTEELTSSEKVPIVNILGATPLDFSLNGSVQSIEKWIEKNGMKTGCCLAMGCTLDDIRQMANADVNLVVSYGGLAAARYLERQFGIPYVVGVPFGEKFSQMLAEEVKITADENESRVAYQTVIQSENMNPEMEDLKMRNVIIGESIFSASLATAFLMDTGRFFRVLCPLDTGKELLRPGDMVVPEEDDILEQIQNADQVIADPLYRPIIETQELLELPHEAFSGRIYDPVNPDLIERNLKGFLKIC